MNGTEHSVDFLSKTIDITDTEAILETMDKYNLGLAALRNFSSIFMGFLKGNPFVVADNTVSIIRHSTLNWNLFAQLFQH